MRVSYLGRALRWLIKSVFAEQRPPPRDIDPKAHRRQAEEDLDRIRAASRLWGPF